MSTFQVEQQRVLGRILAQELDLAELAAIEASGGSLPSADNSSGTLNVNVGGKIVHDAV